MEATAKKATFQKYPAYKDSGVEWLAEIPEHWQAIKMKYLFRDVSEKNKPEAELLSVTQDKGVVPRTWVESRMVMPSGNLESFKFIQKGDFAISLRSFEGGLEYCHHDGIISPAYTVLKKKKGLIDGYYKYLFKSKSFISEIQTSVVGIREGKNISYFELSYSLLPIPSPEEQTAIAAFLDDKTTQIDRAIAQKEKMIALLKERKQIIIQNAVTKGLDPNAKMKHSGVEWIGEIPEGWEVKRLKYIMDKIKTGTTPPTSIQAYFDGGVNWYNPKDLNHEILIDSEKTISQKAIDRNEIKLFEKDSILIVGIGATTGKTAYMSDYGAFNQQITGFHSEKHLNYYYFFLLKSLSTVMLNVASYTTLPILNNEFFKSFWLVVPPLDEQTAIVAHIETQSAKIDKAIKLQEQQIEKLKELKSTLIDSAVTGKLRVPSVQEIKVS